MGGAGAATRVMSPSRGVASGIGRVISDATRLGASDALRPFSLESMSGAPASEVFTALADVLCPEGGTIDEAIAREAMLATAAELASVGEVPFDAMTPAALEAVFLGTISRSIETKLFNELGPRAIRSPADIAAVQRIQRELHAFVAGAVRDAFVGTGESLQTMPRASIDRLVDQVYSQSFEALRILGDSA